MESVSALTIHRRYMETRNEEVCFVRWGYSSTRYLEICSDDRIADNLDNMEVFFSKINEKLIQEPYKSRKVHVSYTLDEEKISYVIRDEGKGFNLDKLPDPLSTENFYKPSGRGILMIRSYCDKVIWNKEGNEITLIKYNLREN